MNIFNTPFSRSQWSISSFQLKQKENNPNMKSGNLYREPWNSLQVIDLEKRFLNQTNKKTLTILFKCKLPIVYSNAIIYSCTNNILKQTITKPSKSFIASKSFTLATIVTEIIAKSRFPMRAETAIVFVKQKRETIMQ